MNFWTEIVQNERQKIVKMKSEKKNKNERRNGKRK